MIQTEKRRLRSRREAVPKKKRIKAGPYSSLMARMLDSGTGSLRMSGWPARPVNGLCFRPLREFLLSLAMADKGKTRSLARPGLRSLWLNCQFIIGVRSGWNPMTLTVMLFLSMAVCMARGMTSM